MFKAVDVKTGKMLWETKLATSVQGFPVSYSIGGKQYIAVTTGKGGGSPWLVPIRSLRKSILPTGLRSACFRAAR